MRRLYPLLQILFSLNPEERAVLLKHLTHEACEALCECVKNGLTNPTLSAEDQRELHQELAPHKQKYRRLLVERDPAKQKKTLLQVGTGVSLILDKVFPLLGNYIA